MEKENNALKIVEVCKVSPLSSLHSSSKFSLSLSSFDWMFTKFPPIERIFFYELSNNSDSLFFNSIIISNLKLSLSLTLQHFLPLAGNLLWPEDSPLPFILYAPNDAVSFTVAETNSDSFHHLSGDHPRQVKESQSLIPKIQPSSDTSIPLLAIQVTHFQNHGFSIGLAFHHVIFDGKSFSLFFKSWAYICNKINQTNSENQLLLLQSCPLPPELTPSFERATHVLQNPFDFAPKDRDINQQTFLIASSDLFRCTFELSPTHIQKLKKRVLEANNSSSLQDQEFHLSTFVVAYAYVLTCLIRAKQEDCTEEIALTLSADARGLLDPPVSSNYFGNCVVIPSMLVEAREFRESEEGFPKIAKRISDIISGLRKTRTIKLYNSSLFDKEQDGHNSMSKSVDIFTVAASPKYKLYQADFGWGKPNKIEIVSLGNNNISLTDARDGGAGLEVGLLLPNHQLNVFASLFFRV